MLTKNNKSLQHSSRLHPGENFESWSEQELMFASVSYSYPGFLGRRIVFTPPLDGM